MKTLRITHRCLFPTQCRHREKGDGYYLCTKERKDSYINSLADCIHHTIYQIEQVQVNPWEMECILFVQTKSPYLIAELDKSEKWHKLDPDVLMVINQVWASDSRITYYAKLNIEPLYERISEKIINNLEGKHS